MTKRFDPDELQRQLIEQDAEDAFERVMGAPSRDWVDDLVRRGKMTASQAGVQRRRLLNRLGDAAHRRAAEEQAAVADHYNGLWRAADMARSLK